MGVLANRDAEEISKQKNNNAFFIDWILDIKIEEIIHKSKCAIEFGTYVNKFSRFFVSQIKWDDLMDPNPERLHLQKAGDHSFFITMNYFKQNLKLFREKYFLNPLKEENGCFPIILLVEFFLIQTTNLFLRRRDGRAV